MTLAQINGLSHTLAKNIRKYDLDDIKVCYKPINNLSTIVYSNMKDKIPKEKTKNVIYEVECNDCDKTYIGQTGQYIKKRMQEHSYDCRTTTGNNNKTALAEHAKTHGHTFNTAEPKILCKVENKRKREIVESICISKRGEKAINYKTDAKTVGSFYSSVINNLKI